MTEPELNAIRAFFGHVARPRAVTVTAVLWLFLGVSWLVGGTFGLGFVMWMTSQLAQFAEQGADVAGPPLVFFWYPGGAVPLGAAGVYYARLLLRLEESGRVGLRRVNVGAVLLFAAFTVNWMLMVTESLSPWGMPQPATAAQAGMALQGLFIGLLVTLPFLYAIKKLGTVEVRYAMRPPGSQPEARQV